MQKAIAGIDPKTKRVEVVATNEPHNWEECRNMGLIVVPTTKENARASWGEVVEDLYALTAASTENADTSSEANDAVPGDRFDARQLATVLAALRFWQREGLAAGGHEHDIASDGGALTPLTYDEINALCEEINT